MSTKMYTYPLKYLTSHFETIERNGADYFCRTFFFENFVASQSKCYDTCRGGVFLKNSSCIQSDLIVPLFPFLLISILI